MSDFHVGIDTVTSPPTLYVKVDGRIYRFDDARDAHNFAISVLSITRFFLHETPCDEPGDRQILRPNK